MKIGAIITGDIIDSTRLTSAERNAMLADLQSLPVLLASIEKTGFEIFRGDSFQIGVAEAAKSLQAALIIRAFLRSRKIESDNRQLDARLAIGIGNLDYQSDSLSTSDGEAYRLSGRLLDKMEKSRLEIATPWQTVNEELKITTAFADEIVSSWTISQSKIALMSLSTDLTHSEIAQKLGVSRQMVDKSLRASREELIATYNKRFETLIAAKITETAI